MHGHVIDQVPIEVARVPLRMIRERFDRTGDTRDAVVFGVGSTARIITGAVKRLVQDLWRIASDAVCQSSHGKARVR